MNVPIVVLCWIEIRMRQSTFCAWASLTCDCNRMTVGRHSLRPTCFSRGSRHNAESQMCCARSLDRACPPQLDPLRVEILEEPDAAAEEDGDEADVHLVQQPG